MSTTDPTNDIDLLMSLDPLDMTEQDIDAIIAYNRNQRAAREAGGAKGRKAPGEKLDLGKLGLKPVAPKLTRRF